MVEPYLIDLTHKGLILVLMLTLPPVIMAAVSGILVSLAQAVTQIQDQTLSFAIKLIAVILTLLLTARWLGIQLLNYALNAFDKLPL